MPQPETAPVLDRITHAVDVTGLTVAEFARVSEIAPDRLTSILSGTRPASSLDLALIATASGATVDWLLNGTPEPVIIACTTD